MEDTSARTSGDFVQSSILEAVVPSNENVDIEDLFRAWSKQGDETHETLLPFIEQRHFLLLDELVPLFIVLRTSSSDAESIQRFLSRLTITVEAFATGNLVTTAASSNTGDTSPHPVQAKDLLHSQVLDKIEQPLILIYSSDPSDILGSIYLIWKTTISIGRPKTRLQKLGVYFAVGASLQAAVPTDLAVPDDEYLPNGIPTSANLLEAFVGDPAIPGAYPHLPMSRISRVAPSSPAARDISSRPIKSAPRRIFRAGPVLAWRIRFTRVPTTLEAPTLIASLDLEATSFASCSVKIEAIDIMLVNGRTESLSLTDHPTLPAICKSGDQFTFMSKLSPGPVWQHSTDHVYALDVNIAGYALIADDCRPKIEIRWKTNIDISPSAPRPTSSSRPNTAGKDLHSAGEPSSSLQNNAAVQDFGVTLTISGPSKVYVGEVFQWRLFVVNRSAEIRRFAILVVPKRATGRPSIRHDGHVSISSADGVKQDDGKGVAEAVVDDNVVHAQLKHGAMEPTELVSLSPDVRIGPLGVSACYTTEIRFLALVKGVLHIDSLRLVDLASQETIDIRDVPDIVAVERPNGIIGHSS